MVPPAARSSDQSKDIEFISLLTIPTPTCAFRSNRGIYVNPAMCNKMFFDEGVKLPDPLSVRALTNSEDRYCGSWS
jgi:hypothetical protein